MFWKISVPRILNNDAAGPGRIVGYLGAHGLLHVPGAFADAELFGPLHMDDVTMEFDGAGTFVGAAHVYAPARSYAATPIS